MWDLKQGREVRTLTGHSAPVTAVIVTPDGQQIISASRDTTLKVWDLASGQAMYTLTGHTKAVNGVAVTPDGRQIVSASGDAILKVWELATREVTASFTGDSPFLACALAPDGVTIVVGEQAGRVHFLQLRKEVLHA